MGSKFIQASEYNSKRFNLRKRPQPIVFVSLPIDANLNDVAEGVRIDKPLVEAIIAYRKDAEKEGIVVHTRRHNMIMTDAGYIYALYESIKPKV